MPILHKNCIITSYLCTGLVLSHLIIPAVFNRHLKDSVIFGSTPAARHTAHAVTMTPAPFSPLKHHVPRNAGKSARSLQFLPALPRTRCRSCCSQRGGTDTAWRLRTPGSPLQSPHSALRVWPTPALCSTEGSGHLSATVSRAGEFPQLTSLTVVPLVCLWGRAWLSRPGEEFCGREEPRVCGQGRAPR